MFLLRPIRIAEFIPSLVDVAIPCDRSLKLDGLAISGNAKFAATSTSCFPTRSFPVVGCFITRDVPKLEFFRRGKFDRILQDPPLIEKVETELSGISTNTF